MIIVVTLPYLLRLSLVLLVTLKIFFTSYYLGATLHFLRTNRAKSRFRQGIRMGATDLLVLFTHTHTHTTCSSFVISLGPSHFQVSLCRGHNGTSFHSRGFGLLTCDIMRVATRAGIPLRYGPTKNAQICWRGKGLEVSYHSRLC